MKLAEALNFGRMILRRCQIKKKGVLGLKYQIFFQDDIKDPEEQLSILKNGASLARPEETNNI